VAGAPEVKVFLQSGKSLADDPFAWMNRLPRSGFSRQEESSFSSCSVQIWNGRRPRSELPSDETEMKTYEIWRSFYKAEKQIVAIARYRHLSQQG